MCGKARRSPKIGGKRIIGYKVKTKLDGWALLRLLDKLFYRIKRKTRSRL
jgi:hypothetical protein